jgi:hypothetical protein
MKFIFFRYSFQKDGDGFFRFPQWISWEINQGEKKKESERLHSSNTFQTPQTCSS